MSDGRRRSPFTGCKKRKAWNKTRGNYIPVKRNRQEITLERETVRIIFRQ